MDKTAFDIGVEAALEGAGEAYRQSYKRGNPHSFKHEQLKKKLLKKQEDRARQFKVDPKPLP